jgi:hypothetical protein
MKLSKRNLVILALVAVVLALVAVGIAVSKMNKPALVNVVPTTVVKTTEQDLNIPIGDDSEKEAKEAKDIINGEEMAGGDNTIAPEQSTEKIGNSLTEKQEIECAKKESGAETSKSETKAEIKVTEPKTTLSQEQVDKQIEEIKEAPVETLDEKINNNMQNYYESIAESMARDPEVIRDIKEHNNN